MRAKHVLIVVLLLGVLLGVVAVSYAQPAALTYGGGAVSQVNAAAPLAVFTFTGAAGDLATVRVVGMTAGFNPTLSVNSPTGQQVAFSTTDITAAAGSARADTVLPQDGVYTVQVGSADGGAGDFIVRLDGISTSNAPVLQTATLLDFTAGPAAQIVTFAASPSAALSLQAPGANVMIHSADGTLIGAAGMGTPFSVPAGSATHYAVITSTTPAAVQVTLAGAAAAPNAAVQPVPTTAPQTGAAACTITTGGSGTNLRTGPGTDYAIIASLLPNQSYSVTGQNSGWYTINYNGQTGWLYGGVTTLSGACDGLATVSAPAGNAPIATEDPGTAPLVPTTAPASPMATSAPTQTQPTQTQPTDTSPTDAPMATSTPTYTPTATEVSAQIAPDDGAHFVEVNIKGGQASHSDVVSYPDGDTQDEVFWSVSGFDSITRSGDVQFIISCSGEGQSNMVFTMAQASYSCGDVFTKFVTNDSDQGLIRATATGGSGVYVNYTILLIGSS